MEDVAFAADPCGGSRRGRVVYLCMWTGTSGGIQVIYEHVRLLRRLGVDAALGAAGPFERCDWFANDAAATPGISCCLPTLGRDDILVVPEICVGAPQLDAVAARRVVFVQNPALLPARLDGYAGAMVPCQALVAWLRETSGFTGPVAVVPGFLHDDLVLPPREFAPGRPRVLLVERTDKHRGEPAAVRALLQGRRDLDVTFADRPVPRAEFTARYRVHDIYLHLSHPEGFPISILEAFGAGCLVVGFSGRGGLEFMRDGDNCFLAGDGDPGGAVAALDRALATPREGLDAMLRSARATALGYGEAGTMAALSQVFGCPAHPTHA